MPDRYFSDSPIIDSHARLEGPEAHHLAHVMRAKPGEDVTLFDGTGAEFLARVEKVGRSSVELAVLSHHEVDRELSRAVTLAVSLPKGDRQRWLVEKLTELGVARMLPLLTAHGVAQPAESALTRLRRVVLEASKQCGRNRLMEIVQPMSCGEFFDAAPQNAVRWVAHPTTDRHNSGNSHGFRSASPAGHAATDLKRELIFAVGPEGGFTDEELKAALGAGWQPLDLGQRILRVETAAIALAAWAAFSACELPT